MDNKSLEMIKIRFVSFFVSKKGKRVYVYVPLDDSSKVDIKIYTYEGADIKEIDPIRCSILEKEFGDSPETSHLILWYW